MLKLEGWRPILLICNILLFYTLTYSHSITTNKKSKFKTLKNSKKTIIQNFTPLYVQLNN